MEILLRGKGLWRFVDGTKAKPSEDFVREMETFSRKSDIAIAYILMTIDQACKASVIRLRYPRDVWNTLMKSYQIVSKASIDANLSALQYGVFGICH